jgi:hypothetical protein
VGRSWYRHGQPGVGSQGLGAQRSALSIGLWCVPHNTRKSTWTQAIDSGRSGANRRHRHYITCLSFEVCSPFTRARPHQYHLSHTTWLSTMLHWLALCFLLTPLCCSSLCLVLSQPTYHTSNHVLYESLGCDLFSFPFLAVRRSCPTKLVYIKVCS